MLILPATYYYYYFNYCSYICLTFFYMYMDRVSAIKLIFFILDAKRNISHEDKTNIYRNQYL